MAADKKTAIPTDTAAKPAEQSPHPVPAQGGSYTLDDASGALTLVERTTDNPGRADQAKPKTKE